MLLTCLAAARLGKDQGFAVTALVMAVLQTLGLFGYVAFHFFDG